MLIVGLTLVSQWIERWYIQKQKRTDQGRRASPRDYRHRGAKQTDGRAIASRIDSLTNQLQSQGDQQERQDNKRSFREKLVLGASIIAALGAIVSAGFLGCQLQDARDVAKVQHQDTINALTLAQRAFVVPTQLDISARIDGDRRYHLITASIENAGNTSTRDLRVYAGMYWNDLSIQRTVHIEGTDPDVTEMEFDSASLPNKWIMGPKARIAIPPLLIDDYWVDRMRQNDLAMYVIGIAYYFDTVGSAEQHKTKFCFKLDPWTGSPDNAGRWGTRRVDLGRIAEISHRPCFHNNCTDKECGPEQTKANSSGAVNMVPKLAGPRAIQPVPAPKP